MLRALPGRIGVVLKPRKSDLGCTVLQAVEPWKASMQQVQKSNIQLGRVHLALCVSVECVAGEPQRLHERRDSCCFRPVAAWRERNEQMQVS